MTPPGAGVAPLASLSILASYFRGAGAGKVDGRPGYACPMANVSIEQGCQSALRLGQSARKRMESYNVD